MDTGNEPIRSPARKALDRDSKWVHDKPSVLVSEQIKAKMVPISRG